MARDRARGAGNAEEDSLPTRLSALIREVVRIPEPSGAAGSTWDQVLRAGAVVGRFELVRELGRGGFGVVYEARDRELDRLVAFKAVLPGRRVDEAFESLQREAEALARLAHPNIVTLYDAGRGEQGPWLSMELLRGQTLSQRLALGPLPVLEAVRVATEVARGLAHAHAHGVVHRDLSPRNVFLGHDGQVKLLDLGLAHVFGRRRVTGGTPNYVAPEQWRGAPEDERTDVFSLGVMLFRMLTGEFPVPEDGGTRDEPVPVVDVTGAPALGPLVSGMLARDPVERPRDADEVLKALEAFRGELDRTPTSATSKPTVRRQRSRRARRLVAGVALAALAAVGGFLGYRSWEEAHRPPPSIAVMPFEDLSPEKDQSLFADGLAEEVLAELGAVDGLRVPGRTSSFSFRGKGAPPAEIGRALGVGAILEGSVRRQGNRIKVVAQVVSAADGLRLWGRAFERELTDVFEVQEEIAAAVVQALQVKVVGLGAAGSPGRPPPPKPEAYTLYLAGREELRQLRRGSYRRAADLLERSVAIDPAFAPAWAALARPLLGLVDEAAGPEAADDLRRRALAAAEKALALDPRLPEAWSIRGTIRMYAFYDLQAARADLERSVALNANEPAVRARYAYLLQARGQAPEAVREARAAAELDPLSTWWTALGTAYVGTGDFARAEEAYRRQLEVTPAGTYVQIPLATTLILQGRAAEALAMAPGLPAESYRLWVQAAAEHGLGRAAAARATADAYVARFGAEDEYESAMLLAWLGRRDEAFAWLGKALAARRSQLFLQLSWSPWVRGLRDDPRYAALQREVQAIGAKGRP